MRIFLVYHPSGNLSVPNSTTWYKNLYAPLFDIGHEVYPLRLDEFCEKHQVVFRSKKYKELVCNEIKEVFEAEHQKNPFDLFFAYLTNNDIESSVIDEIKKSGVPTANFSCNNTHQFHLVEAISPSFDYNLYSEKDAVDKFKKVGANAIWFPMAANPNYYFPKKGAFNYDVSFIGAAYAKRAYYIEHLFKEKVEVDCFGPNWLINKPNARIKKIKKETERLRWIIEAFFSISPKNRMNLSIKIGNFDIMNYLREQNYGHFHYPISDEEMIDIVSVSKINLGFLEVFSEFGEKKIQQHLHLREFEIPMCGGLYITNYSDELTEFYEIGKEVITFRNEYELTDKINYYLNHENEAEKIRKAAFERAINCHTYQKRFTELFQKLNLK